MQAIRKNITYPKYAWIMFDWYPKNWWKQLNGSNITCSEDQLARFLDKVLTLRRYPEADDVNATTDAGIVRESTFFIETNLDYRDIIWCMVTSIVIDESIMK